jgi:signal transduction histidine kinase
MTRSRAGAMTLHVEAAKRLLAELEQQALAAQDALGRDSVDGVDEFTAAIDARDQILGKLTEVVDAIAHERGADSENDIDVDAGPIFAEMARVAAAALESQQKLTAQAMRERNRLAAALHNTNRPDSIASQYAASGTGRQATLSVRG